MKKKSVSRSNDDLDGRAISSGVLAISSANAPKPTEKSVDEANEHDHGPYLSIAFPTSAAKGYWPIMPLGCVSIRVIYQMTQRYTRKHDSCQLWLSEFEVLREAGGEEWEGEYTPRTQARDMGV